ASGNWPQEDPLENEWFLPSDPVARDHRETLNLSYKQTKNSERAPNFHNSPSDTDSPDLDQPTTWDDLAEIFLDHELNRPPTRNGGGIPISDLEAFNGPTNFPSHKQNSALYVKLIMGDTHWVLNHLIIGQRFLKLQKPATAVAPYHRHQKT
ncbi:Uncharacterized protein APZ42_008117, partial [Daphnia magna]